MDIRDIKSIAVRGTGKYATKLMEEIMSYKTSAPDFHSIIVEKICCFIDAEEKRQGSDFYGFPVVAPNRVTEEKAVTYVVAIADYRTVYEELIKEGVDPESVVKSNDFIKQLHKELISGKYKIQDDDLRRKVEDAGWLLTHDLSVDQNNAFAVRAVKALFFLFLQDVLSEEKTVEFICAEERAGMSLSEVGTVGLFTTTYGGGGAERVVSKLGEMLAGKSYDTVVAIDRLSQYDYSKSKGIDYYYFDNLSADCFDKYIDELCNLLTEKHMGVSIFHMPYEGYMLYYKVLLCKLMGIRTIVEFHTSFINALCQRDDLEESIKTYKLADYLVVLSKTDEVFWKDKGVNAVYIPNPVISDHDHDKPGVEIKREDRSLIWVGRLDNKYKRVLDLIPITLKVKSEIQDIKIYVVGAAVNESDEKILKQQIIANNLQENIILCGFVRDIDEYYQRSSAMIMTSPGEGFPMALAEAKAKGLPTVMYDLPYLEMVKDGKGVITVKQGDIEALACEVIGVIKDKGRREELSKQALESAEYFINYNIVGAWEKVLRGITVEEDDEESKQNERRLIINLLAEYD